MARRKIGESRREEKQGMTGMAATPGGAPGMNPGMDRGAEEMMPQEAMAGRPDMGGMAGMMPGGAAESMEALAATIASQRIAMKAGAEAEQMAGENAEEKRIRQQRPGEGGMVPVNGPADENEADGAGAFWSDGGTAMVREAAQILQKYKQGKANLERRIIDNEQWYKMRHWEQIRGRSNGAGASGDPEDPQPASAWLFNSIANKHADAMDNYPEPNVLPREAGDKEEAEKLSAVLPVILENNRFESIYSDVWWYKLKTGTGVYGVFWNPKAENGLGDIEIRQLDILSLFWEPGIKDIQKSRNLFSVELVDNDVLKSQYPVLEGKLGTPSVDVAQYIYDDSVDTSEKSAVVDWYYKRWNGARQILHYCKFVGDTVLYASEADPNYRERGFYDHGKYPVIFDTLFVEEGTPAGFGYIDVMKDAQLYIDKLGQIILKNVLMSGKKRFFIKDTGSVNEEEFADWSRDFVHVAGSSLGQDSIREIEVKGLDSGVVNVLQMKIEELKETSGNRDFSQGSTAAGVTAASAIAALQEAGSKLSRDMLKSAYRAFTDLDYLILELIRQFYDEPRCFRITGEEGERFLEYDNRGIRPASQGQAFGVDLGERRPVFDIRITSQKSSPFSKIAQNELAKELYGMGMFRPDMADQALAALAMMDFEGKEMVTRRIGQNGTLYQMVQQMQQQMQKMAMIIDAQNGTSIAGGMGAEAEGTRSMAGGKGEGGGRTVNVGALGQETAGREGLARRAEEHAAGAAKPK